MFRIAICDDMPDILASLKSMLQLWQPASNRFSVSLFENGTDLIQSHNNQLFDIIILDVIMPELNGIETAAEIRKTDSSVKIIYLTSSPEFAIESYSVKATNYLLKPVDSEKLFTCLEECFTDILNHSKSITVKNSTSIHQVILRNIEYVESQGKYVLFTLTNGDTIQSLTPLYAFENELLLSDGFFKCHRSYIVNMHKVDTYTSKELKMTSGYRIPIARSCQKDFESAYFDLVFGKVGDK